MDIDTYSAVARQALERYGLSKAVFRIVKSSNNAVFRVDTEKESYALRVHRPGYRKLAWIEAELEWLSAICRETHLCVPQPAAPVFHGRVGDAPVYCTLLTWLEGQPKLPAETAEEDAYNIGVFIGKLHEHSAHFASMMKGELPPLDIVRRLEDMSAFADAGLLSNGDYVVLESFLSRIRIVIKELEDTASIQIPLHGDLIWKNFIFQDTTVCAIDFDDCAYGFPLYDLAPLLLGYLDEQHYTTLKQAAWVGYTSVLPQPDSHQQLLESLIAARFALSIHWIAANRNNPALQNRASEIITSRVKRLKAYLDTGKLERGEIIL